MEYELFARNLKWIRRTNKLSQEKLADEIGASRGVVSQWELGKNGATLEAAERICKRFLLKLDDLYFRDLSENPVIKQENTELENFSAEKDRLISSLKEIIQSQKGTIQAQETTIKTLTELLNTYRSQGEKKAG